MIMFKRGPGWNSTLSLRAKNEDGLTLASDLLGHEVVAGNADNGPFFEAYHAH
jgi:hypothetical protein